MKNAFSPRRLACLAGSLVLAAACQKSAPGSASGASGQVAQSTPIKVGYLGPLSGNIANLGESSVRGIEMYLATHGGALAGHPVQFVKEDSEFKPDVGVQKIRKLVEQDRVDVLVGIASSSVAYAVRDIIHQSKVPTIVNVAVANGLTRAKKSPYIFRINSNSYQQMAPLGEWLPRKGLKTAYLLSMDYAAGKEATADFVAAFEKGGGKVLGQVYFPIGTKDYAPYLSEVLKAQPQVLAGFWGGSDAVNLTKQADSFGLFQKGIKMAGSGYGHDQDLLPAEGKSALGIYNTMQWSPDLDTPQNKQFMADYKARYNDLPNVAVVTAYDAMSVLAEALKQVGGTADKEALVKALEKVDLDSLEGKLRFDPESHQAVLDMMIREVRESGGITTNVKVDVFTQVKDPGQ